MRVIVRLLIAIVLVLVVIVVVLGPAKIVAGVEYPFGVGPWSSTGRYCHDMYGLTQFVDKSFHSGQALTSDEKADYGSYENTLTETGPHVPRADFTAFFGGSGKKMTSEGKLLNTWWNQNCADAVMNAPASANRVMAGVVSHEKFTHYPKNVLNVVFYFKFPAD
jgi:hypothetical protein